MIIISINVFEKPEFLEKQLNNIKDFVKIDYKIILNCNDYMFECLKNEVFENIIINPEVINKRRFHGSVVKGIYSNLKYCVENKIEFSHFMVLSSRCLFYNQLKDLSYFCEDNKINGKSKEIVKDPRIDPVHSGNAAFCKTLLYLEFFNNYEKISLSLHEGTVFNFNVCQNIISFLESHEEIKNNLFNFDSVVEEFALQTISVNYKKEKEDIGYWTTLYPETSINNYTAEEAEFFPKNKYIYRTFR